MGHYRHGRKVPALPPAQHNAIRAVSIVLVFALVALTTWRPALFAAPALVVIVGLAGLDQSVVTAGGRARPAGTGTGDPLGRGAAEGVSGLDDPDSHADTAAITLALPRGRSAGSRLRPSPDDSRATAGDDVLSWSPLDEAGLDDPIATHTMAIDMRVLLDDGPAWVR
ncbi:hypothetical protein [Frankia sp. CiP3]|uniref:hypothetical protein n=1 Tax=Frankia sp. CiP3 TaxID=2880971 RepID=UPI001EF5F6F4|nr:hypothetical protein [Frankia sp. CiP3]